MDQFFDAFLNRIILTNNIVVSPRNRTKPVPEQANFQDTLLPIDLTNAENAKRVSARFNQKMNCACFSCCALSVSCMSRK